METNLFDLILRFFRWFGSLFVALWHLLLSMLGITYRHFAIVCAVVALSAGVSLYYSRPTNRIYVGRMLLQLNGTTWGEAQRIVEPLMQMVPDRITTQMSLSAQLGVTEDDIQGLKGIVFKNVKKLDEEQWGVQQLTTDTLASIYPVLVALELKTKNLPKLQAVADKLVQYMNSDSVLVRNYNAYYATHSQNQSIYANQLVYIDSLAKHIYVENPSVVGTQIAGNTLLVGEQRKQTFEDELQTFARLAEIERQLLSQATAPVAVISQMSIKHSAINSLKKCLVLFSLLGWVTIVALLAMYENRRALVELINPKIEK